MKTILNHALRLMAACFIASALLAFVYEATFSRIESNRAKEKALKIKSVLPEDVDDIKEVEINGKICYEGFSEGIIKGTVLEVSEKGYSGPIKILVGIDPQETIIAINVLFHKETPGLGNKIEKPKFKDQFKSLSLKGLVLKKDIQKIEDKYLGLDAITAATVSSRAVVKAVRKAFEDIKGEKSGK